MLSNKFAKDFRKYGLTLNKDKFVKIFPKFLETSEITDVDSKSFDFLTAPKSPINKKVLKAYQEAINFLQNATPQQIAKKSTVYWDVKINLLAQKLLNYSKKYVMIFINRRRI